MYLNKVILIGKAGKDPEVKTLTSGTTVSSFSLATNEFSKDKQGNRHTRTEWFNIEVWGTAAEIAGDLIKKGNTVMVEGSFKTEEYTDKEGIKRTTTKVRSTNFQIMREAKPEEQTDAPKTVKAKVEPIDDELPF